MGEPVREGAGWVYRFELPLDDQTGKRRQKRVSAPTKAGCLAKARAAIAAAADTGRAERDQTLNAYLDHYLAHVVPHRSSKAGTARTYAVWCAQHIRPALGATRLSRLTASQCERWISDLEATGCAPKSIRAYGGVLASVLTHAVDARILAHNPMRGVSLPHAPSGQRRVWSVAEGARFLEYARRDVYNPLWLLGLVTGARIGEVIALRWDDIDMAARRLTIARSWTAANGEYTTPKSGHARIVALDDATLAELARHHTAQQALRRDLGRAWAQTAEDGDLVCTSTVGTRVRQPATTARLRRICEAADVPFITFHGLRRVHITRLLDAGHDIGLVARRVGHSDTRTTRQFYYTLEDHAERRLADGVRSAVVGEEDVRRRDVSA